MSYFLFFSYSTGIDPDATEHKRQFYKDLVAKIESHPDFKLKGEKLGFLDADMVPGADWGDELGKALRTCTVFVYLQEQLYFNFKERPWCGREWHIFNNRVHEYWKKHDKDAPRPPLMVPIQWQLVPKLADAASQIQYKNRDLGEEYGELGLYALKSRPENTRIYTTFVANLAQYIVNLGKEHQLPVLDVLPPFQNISDPFAPKIPQRTNALITTSGGPRRVDFVYIVPGKDKLEGLRSQCSAYADDGDPILWKPYFPPTEDTVVSMAETQAYKKKLVPSRIPFGADLIQRLVDAQAAHKIVILIIDPWSLRVPEYRSIMKDYGTKNFWNCVVIVPWNEDDETKGQATALADLVEQIFYELPEDRVRKQIRSTKDFLRNLEKAFLAAQKKIEGHAKFRDVDGPGSRTLPTFS